MSDTIKISATVRSDFGKGLRAPHPHGRRHPRRHLRPRRRAQARSTPGHATTLAARVPNAILDLDIEGESHLAMIKDIQRHAIRPELQHIDLLTVKRGERVEIEVPVHVEGEPAVGAVANQEETVLLVEADALKAPEALIVSIEGREAGAHVLASDVELPSGVTLVADAELLIVNVSGARGTRRSRAR